MKKILFAIPVLFAWTTSLQAQITREQADVIVLEFLKNREIQAELLYVHVSAPNREGIAITTSNEETFKAKYACRAYYLNESDFSRSRYLFVTEDNHINELGVFTHNVLEIIAHNDSGPDDFDLWERVDITSWTSVTERGVQQPYPNPVNGLLTIPCNGENVHIEIYDLNGARHFSGPLSGENNCQLNVSFLNTGVYIVSVNGEAFKISKN